MPTLTYLLTISIVTLSGSFHFGYQMGAFNGASVHVRQSMNETLFNNFGLASTKAEMDWIWSAFGAIMFVGSICGALLGVVILPRLTHRQSLLLNAVVGVVGSVVQAVGAFVPNVVLLFVGKFIIGGVIAYGFNIQTVYLMSITAVNLRGAANVLSAAQIQVGIISGLLLALNGMLGSADLWPYLCIVELAVSIFHLVGVFIMCHEKRVPVVVALDTTEATEPKISLKEIISNRSIRTGLILGVLVNTAAAMTGINVLVGYSAQFLHTMFDNERATLLALFISPFSFVGIGLCAYFIERVGRRVLLISSTLFCALVHLAITVTLYIDETHVIGYIFTGEMCLFLVCFGYGVGSISLFITAELVPNNAAPICQSIGTCAMLGTSGILSLIFPPLFEIVGNSMFLLFVVSLLLANVAFFVYLPETANRPPKDVSEDLANGFRLRGRGRKVVGLEMKKASIGL